MSKPYLFDGTNKYIQDLGEPGSVRSFGETLHSGSISSPRGLIGAKMYLEQIRSPRVSFDWDDGSDKALFDRRNSPLRQQRLAIDPKLGDTGVTDMALRSRFLRGRLSNEGSARVVDKLRSVPRYAYGDPLLDSIGKWGVANHELEHANDQAFDPAYVNRGEMGSVTEHEIPPAIGDMVFMGERAKSVLGRPLKHTVEFPSGLRHDLTWMMDQAKRHGYWDGRSMTDLLYNTPEGRQWVKTRTAGYFGDTDKAPASSSLLGRPLRQ